MFKTLEFQDDNNLFKTENDVSNIQKGDIIIIKEIVWPHGNTG